MNGLPKTKQESGFVPDVIPLTGIKTKRCGKCKETKEVNEFHKNKRTKTGYACHCKQCCSEEHKQIYIDNREEILKQNHKWHVENKEYHESLNERWRIGHPEESKAIRRKAAKTFRSTTEGAIKNKLWNKAWEEAHIEEKRQSCREWHENNPERSKQLRRKSELMRLYGLSQEQYDAMVISQENKCYICGKPPKKNILCVDHCHKTKVVRKLLCQGCNHALGWVEKGEDHLLIMLGYLAEHGDQMAANIIDRLKNK